MTISASAVGFVPAAAAIGKLNNGFAMTPPSPPPPSPTQSDPTRVSFAVAVCARAFLVLQRAHGVGQVTQALIHMFVLMAIGAGLQFFGGAVLTPYIGPDTMYVIVMGFYFAAGICATQIVRYKTGKVASVYEFENIDPYPSADLESNAVGRAAWRPSIAAMLCTRDYRRHRTRAQLASLACAFVPILTLRILDASGVSVPGAVTDGLMAIGALALVGGFAYVAWIALLRRRYGRLHEDVSAASASDIA